MHGDLHIRVPKPLENAVKEKAEQQDSSVSNYLRSLILRDMFIISDD